MFHLIGCSRQLTTVKSRFSYAHLLAPRGVRKVTPLGCPTRKLLSIAYVTSGCRNNTLTLNTNVAGKECRSCSCKYCKDMKAYRALAGGRKPACIWSVLNHTTATFNPLIPWLRVNYVTHAYIGEQKDGSLSLDWSTAG